MQDDKGLRPCSVLNQRPKKWEYTMVSWHHLASSNVVSIRRSSNDNQEIGGHHVFHNVQYAHIGKTYAIILFGRSNIPQQTLQSVSERRFKSYVCS